MSTLVRFTTNVDPNIMDFIISQSKALKTTKRKVLEKAVQLYAKMQKRKELAQGYDMLADDNSEMDEWLDIANNPKNL